MDREHPPLSLVPHAGRYLILPRGTLCSAGVVREFGVLERHDDAAANVSNLGPAGTSQLQTVNPPGPSVGRKGPFKTGIGVDLPAAEGPMMAVNCSEPNSRFAPCRARVQSGKITPTFSRRILSTPPFAPTGASQSTPGTTQDWVLRLRGFWPGRPISGPEPGTASWVTS